MRETIKYGLILGLICFLSSSVLAVVNGITEPKIKLQKEKEELLALKEALPESASFRPVFQEAQIIYYTAYDSDAQLNGFVIKSQGKGYSANIEVLAGLNLNLEIVNARILSQNETPGLGNRIIEPAFLEQFKGKNLDSFSRVQAITGATVSSGAVINALKNRISELKEKLFVEASYAR
jgi:electron transport complex protein RnfG